MSIERSTWKLVTVDLIHSIQRSSQKAVVTGYFNASNQSNKIFGKLNEGFHRKSNNYYKSR